MVCHVHARCSYFYNFYVRHYRKFMFSENLVEKGKNVDYEDEILRGEKFYVLFYDFKFIIQGSMYFPIARDLSASN